MARVLIAGCGDVGSALGLRLHAAGHEAFGLRRNVAALPEGITPVAADLNDPSSLGDALREAVAGDLHYLVYTAAASGFEDAAYQRAYVTGVDNVLAAVDRERLARVVFVSSTGVVAQSDGEWVDETSPTRPAGFSGRRLLEGEARIAACGPSSVSVRFGGIYGPGRTRLLRNVRAGEPCRDEPVSWTNRIHRDDCAGVLEHLLFLDGVEPLYLGVDCEPAPQCAVMDWLAQRMDCAPVPRRSDGGTGGRRGGNKRCSNARLLASGYRFRYPTYREGYAAVLES